MFSILVSELTPQLIEKSEWWAITTPARITPPFWKDTRHREDFSRGRNGSLTTRGGMEVYGQDYRCFPVTLSPDGTEVRLECPRMPDEECVGPLSEDAIFADYDADDHGWNFYKAGHRRILFAAAPTPEHYPRRTCDGVWVWSTRR